MSCACRNRENGTVLLGKGASAAPWTNWTRTSQWKVTQCRAVCLWTIQHTLPLAQLRCCTHFWLLSSLRIASNTGFGNLVLYVLLQWHRQQILALMWRMQSKRVRGRVWFGGKTAFILVFLHLLQIKVHGHSRVLERPTQKATDLRDSTGYFPCEWPYHSFWSPQFVNPLSNTTCKELTR